jgi:hypothetical protein
LPKIRNTQNRNSPTSPPLIDTMLLRLGRYCCLETQAPELNGIHAQCEQALRKSVLELPAVSKGDEARSEIDGRQPRHARVMGDRH